MHNVLRQRYERHVCRYYSQMVVEYRYEEDVPENEQELILKKLSIKDSSIRQPNAVLDSWRRSDSHKMDEHNFGSLAQPLQRGKGSALFRNALAVEEETKIPPVRRQAHEVPETFQINTGGNRRKVNSVFEYQTASHGVPTIQPT